MMKGNEPDKNIKVLMDVLKSENGANRQKARKSLVALGKPAVSSLTRALQNSKLDQVRREAVQALGAIGDPRVIPSLVNVLEDSDPDVAWLAADVLRKFKKEAWPALLKALLKSGSESVSLRQGAHHIFRNQKENGFDDLLAILVEDLGSSMVRESTPVAAYDMLKRMKANS
jgi:HEAT repeat protein